MGYTKLFSTLITSTIWSEDKDTKLIWVTMLAMADRRGEVHATIPGLARMAGVEVEAVNVAIEKFLSPDIYSRTKTQEGRRIEEIDGGWALINYQKYRDSMTAEDNAARQARWRERQKSNAGNGESQESNGEITAVTQAEAEAEAEAEAGKTSGTTVSPERDTASEAQKPPRRRGATVPDSDWIASLKTNAGFVGIDIDREFGKAQTWCENKKRTLTRTRFINWLNRCEPPMAANAKPKLTSRPWDKGGQQS